MSLWSGPIPARSSRELAFVFGRTFYRDSSRNLGDVFCFNTEVWLTRLILLCAVVGLGGCEGRKCDHTFSYGVAIFQLMESTANPQFTVSCLKCPGKATLLRTEYGWKYFTH